MTERTHVPRCPCSTESLVDLTAVVSFYFADLILQELYFAKLYSKLLLCRLLQELKLIVCRAGGRSPADNALLGK